MLSDPQKRKLYDCGQSDFDGDTGFSGFGNMGENIHFSNGNGNGTTQFFFNGQDMSGMGIDPSQLFSMFFSNGGGGHDDFGFGSSFGGMRGGMRGESGQGNNNAGSSNFSNFDF